MSIMCGKIIFHHTPRFFLWLENVVISKYNKYSKLTLTKKIEEPLSMRVSACSGASLYYYLRSFSYPQFWCWKYFQIY